MSELSLDPLTQRALVSAQAIRDKEITESAQLALAADDQLLRRGDAEGRLAEETVRLTARMEWLHRHPYLSRAIGRSAVGVLYPRRSGYYVGAAIETPLLMEGDKTAIGEHILTEGIIFARTIPRDRLNPTGDQRLHIFRTVIDEVTGHEERERPYEIFWYRDNSGYRVQVEGKTFEDYAARIKADETERYAVDHPWVSKYVVTEHDVFRSRLLKGIEPMSEEKIAREKAEIKQIRAELVPELKQGTGWHYPDELYMEPLSLVSQANDLLGRQKWR